MKRWSGWGLLGAGVLVAVLALSLVHGLGGPAPPRTNVETAPLAPEAGERPRVEVLNAAGVPGLARGITLRLRRARVADVVFYGNAAGPALASSVVIARSADAAAARSVADALGIEQVRSEPDSTLYLEATVLVGRDLADPPPQTAPHP